MIWWVYANFIYYSVQNLSKSCLLSPGPWHSIIYVKFSMFTIGRGRPAARRGVPQRIACTEPTCPATFRSCRGLTNHVHTFHQDTHHVHYPQAHHGLDSTPPSPHGMDVDDVQFQFNSPPNSPHPPACNTPPPQNKGIKIYHPILNGEHVHGFPITRTVLLLFFDRTAL